MAASLKGRDFISIHDYTAEEVQFIFDTTRILKTEEHMGIRRPILKDKNLAMIFQKSSTRTRVSFEIGMNQMGGKAIFLSNNDIQLNRGETVADTARVLCRYVDGIMARVFDHQDILDLAKNSNVPVINGLSDFLHPCQAMADFYTMFEKRGFLKGLHLVYIGDSNNVSNSLMIAAAKTGVHMTICSPRGHEPSNIISEWYQQDTGASGSTFHLTADPVEAVKDADFIYTDVWASMGQEKEAEERKKLFATYQINKELMGNAPSHALVLHCLPAHRGEEITDDVIDSCQSIVFDEAENRLHVQKAIMALIMS